MKGELPFASPCVVGHEITGEVVEYGAHTDNRIKERYNYMCQEFVRAKLVSRPLCKNIHFFFFSSVFAT